ncbi:LysR family transcriptional regulator [Nocardia sp. NPDC051052]|uniref:LysR family transcriptional regulator n=1 Tax=Nocardia sp. NPDC051052 TaxID=3364322 RepID=UPI00378C3D57
MDPVFGFTLTQLLHFVTVAECGSISTAAERLHAGQPGISMSIRRLEKNLGVLLFERRSSGGVELTSRGRIYLELADAIVTHARALSEATDRTDKRTRTPVVRIGSLQSLTPALIRTLRPAFAKQGKQVTILDGAPAELTEWLSREICLAAVTFEALGDQRSDNLAFIPAATTKVLAISSAGHPLAKKKTPVSLAEVFRYRVAVVTTGTVVCYLDRIRGPEQPSTVEVKTIEAFLSLVESGSCVGFLSQVVLDLPHNAPRNIRAVPLDIELPAARIGILTLPSHRDDPMVAIAVEAVRSLVPGSESPPPLPR